MRERLRFAAGVARAQASLNGGIEERVGFGWLLAGRKRRNRGDSAVGFDVLRRMAA
jgi:hypothetical protein